MNLYLMRHADAGVARDNPVLDAKRALIKEGKEQCMLMARVLSAFKVQIDVIVSSPLKRATQTASLVGNEMGYEGKLQIEVALRPGATFADFRRLLERIIVRQPFGRKRDQSSFARETAGANQVDPCADRSSGDIDGFENHFTGSFITPGQRKESIGYRRGGVMNEFAV